MILVYDGGAEVELWEIYEFYLEESTRSAELFMLSLQRTEELLIDFPKAGTLDFEGTRRIPLRKYPYNVYYNVRGSVIQILALFTRKENNTTG